MIKERRRPKRKKEKKTSISLLLSHINLKRKYLFPTSGLMGWCWILAAAQTIVSFGWLRHLLERHSGDFIYLFYLLWSCWTIVSSYKVFFFYCSALRITKCQPLKEISELFLPKKRLRKKKVKVPELFLPRKIANKEKI